MSESLIVQLRAGVAPSWMVCNDEGQVLVSAVSGELVQAVPLSVGRRVAVIVPASEVLVTESDAPAKNAAKLAQVIPFALEERVADEIENLHFAIGARSAETGRVQVAVVEHARINGWLAELRAAGLQPQAIYCESQLVPAMPGQLIALLDGESLIMRTAEGVPLIMPARSIRDAFEMALATQVSQVAGLEPPPLGLLLYVGHDDWQVRQPEVEALRERFTGMKVQLLPSGALSVLAPAAASGDAVNLLQGALAITSPCRRTGRRGGSPRRSPAHCSACTSARAISNSRDCARARSRSMPASRTPSVPPCPASRTRPMRAAASRQGWRKSMAVAAAAPCCPRCQPSPMRAVPHRRPISKASRFVTARSTCESPHRTQPVSMPLASNCARELESRHSRRQRQWRQLPWPAPGEKGRRMMDKLQQWYGGLEERERRFVTIGAIAAVVLVLAGVILPLNSSIARTRQRVAAKQVDLAFIQSAGPQIAAAGPSAGAATGESLVVLIDSSARESGLGKSLTSSQPTGDGGLRIRLDHAPFDGIVAWLARLSQQHGVRVESAEIETAGETGMVNAGFVLKTG